MKSPGAGVFFFAVIAGFILLSWQLKLRWDQRFDVAAGAYNGFDLTVCLVDSTDLYNAGVERDGLHSLDLPPFLDAAGLDSLNAEVRGGFLLPRDRVIGVALGGLARAYPLAILDWHEVVNDTLAGRAILVSWNPLCGAAAVYARAVAGEEKDFGVSGILLDSNTLLYDRGPRGADGAFAPGGESLWSQLTGAALSGPAAARGDTLAPVACDLTHWSDWSARHPETLALSPNPRRLSKYRRKPYTSYLGNENLQYPVRRLPPAGGLALKTPVLALSAGGETRLYPLPLLAERAGPDGVWRFGQGGEEFEARVFANPPAVTLRDAGGEPLPGARQAFWFAWFSRDPDGAPPRLIAVE